MHAKLDNTQSKPSSVSQLGSIVLHSLTVTNPIDSLKEIQTTWP